MEVMNLLLDSYNDEIGPAVDPRIGTCDGRNPLVTIPDFNDPSLYMLDDARSLQSRRKSLALDDLPLDAFISMIVGVYGDFSKLRILNPMFKEK